MKNYKIPVYDFKNDYSNIDNFKIEQKKSNYNLIYHNYNKGFSGRLINQKLFGIQIEKY